MIYIGSLFAEDIHSDIHSVTGPLFLNEIHWLVSSLGIFEMLSLASNLMWRGVMYEGNLIPIFPYILDYELEKYKISAFSIYQKNYGLFVFLNLECYHRPKLVLNLTIVQAHQVIEIMCWTRMIDYVIFLWCRILFGEWALFRFLIIFHWSTKIPTWTDNIIDENWYYVVWFLSIWLIKSTCTSNIYSRSHIF